MTYKYREELGNLKPNISPKVADAPGKVHRLMANENPYGCSPLVKDALIRSMENGPSNYPDGYTTDVRIAISEKYGVDKDEILFGNGTDEIIYMLGKAFVAQGDEIVTPAVSFTSYIPSAVSMGGKMVYVPMKEDHSIDLDGIINAITEKTKYIVIVNPNNPTGTVFCEDEQYEFLKKVPKDVLVIFDEAYAEFYMGENFPNTYAKLKEFDNLIILKTFSKVYGLASFRIGFMIANKEIISWVSRIKNAFNVSAQAMAAAAAAVLDNEFVSMVRENNSKCIKYLCGELDKLGYSYIPTNTSFIMTDMKKNCMETVAALKEKGYLVRPGSDFTMDNYIRVSIGTMDQMKGFIEAFKEITK
ncbi:MAG: histidinol-phosphate transaminase [Defluviitaleaceae bacterium]|nr:histidinol-phosphate transaminase [Defluviitaleaceae bacterium]